TDVYGRLFVYLLALSLIGDVLGLLPFGLVLSILVSLALSGFLLFTIPLIVDQRLDVMAAVRGSAEALRGQVPMAILFALVVGLLASVGAALCVVPVLFTAPVAVSALGVLYRDFFPESPVAPVAAPGAPPVPPV